MHQKSPLVPANFTTTKKTTNAFLAPQIACFALLPDAPNVPQITNSKTKSAFYVPTPTAKFARPGPLVSFAKPVFISTNPRTNANPVPDIVKSAPTRKPASNAFSATLSTLSTRASKNANWAFLSTIPN